MDRSVIDSIRELERSMRVATYIPHDEVDRIAVNLLIGIRNSEVNARKDMTHFDKVILHFLDEEELQRYVINKEEIKP